MAPKLTSKECNIYFIKFLLEMKKEMKKEGETGRQNQKININIYIKKKKKKKKEKKNCIFSKEN